MSRSFAFRPRARLDVLEQFLYLADQATAEALLFYVPRASGIDVVRVLHGARDIEHLFTKQEA